MPETVHFSDLECGDWFFFSDENGAPLDDSPVMVRLCRNSFRRLGVMGREIAGDVARVLNPDEVWVEMVA